MSEDTDLPKALIKRIAKSKLASLEKENGIQESRDIQISKDALLALSESARVFIHYLTATGNDICKEAKRQIMSVDDIFTALDDLEFSELLPPLKESLEGFKVENKEKSKKRAEQQKKRKLEDAERQAAEAARQAEEAIQAPNEDATVANLAANANGNVAIPILTGQTSTAAAPPTAEGPLIAAAPVPAAGDATTTEPTAKMPKVDTAEA